MSASTDALTLAAEQLDREKLMPGQIVEVLVAEFGASYRAAYRAVMALHSQCAPSHVLPDGGSNA